MKIYPLHITEFQNWVALEKVLYSAQNTKSGKTLKLYASVTGNKIIIQDGKVVWQGIQNWNAIDEYNKLLEE